MKMNIKFNFDVKINKFFSLETDGEKIEGVPKNSWIIEGYAATSHYDTQGDIIKPDALKEVESSLLQNSTVLYNHDPDEEIGKIVHSEFTNKGLLVKVMISKTREDIWTKIKEGVLNKFSIAGICLESKEEYIEELRNFVHVIYKLRIDEVSIVPIPANPKAEAIAWYISKAIDEYRNNLQTKEIRIDDAPSFKVTKSYEDENDNNFYIEGFASTTDIDKDDEMFSASAMIGIRDGLIKNPTVFYNHDTNYPIGAVKQAEIKEKDGKYGVWVKILISKTEETIITKIKEGILTGLSIGGKAVAAFQEFSEKIGRAIDIVTRFLCYEVSLVGIPSNDNARALDYYISKAFKINKKYNKDDKKINKIEKTLSNILQNYILYNLNSENKNERLTAQSQAIESINGIIEYLNQAAEINEENLLPYPYPEAVPNKISLSISEITSSLIGFLINYDQVVPQGLSARLKRDLYSLTEKINELKDPSLSDGDDIIDFKNLNFKNLIEKSKSYKPKKDEIDSELHTVKVKVDESEKEELINLINKAKDNLEKEIHEKLNKNNNSVREDLLEQIKNLKLELKDLNKEFKEVMNYSDENLRKKSVEIDEKIEKNQNNFIETLTKINSKIEKFSTDIENKFKDIDNHSHKEFKSLEDNINSFKEDNNKLDDRIKELENDGGFSKSIDGQEIKKKINQEKNQELNWFEQSVLSNSNKVSSE